MKLSHSKLGCILSCPMSYYLNYIEGISKVEEKPALRIGSAYHWGVEHETEDLTGFFGEDANYAHDEWLAEAMVHGYLKHKDEVFNEILSLKDGSKLKLIDEQHEVYITGKLKSYRFTVPHDFVGIIDLLLLVENEQGQTGFIVLDHKTSSQTPNWDSYLEQIYRYIFLLRSEFPDIPVFKIGIINARKTMIRQKRNENAEQFIKRMQWEYELNDEKYIAYHEYLPEELDSVIINNYIDNLSKMADVAAQIDKEKMWYINYGAAWGQYGKSDYYDIFYKVPDCYVEYKIRDTFIDDNNDKVDSRPCVPIDMLVIDNNNVMNHYSYFKNEADLYEGDNLLDFIKKKYITDDNLLSTYNKMYSNGF